MNVALRALVELQTESQALLAVHDPDDRLSYANAAYRSAFFIGETECPLWPDLMRRNHLLGRGSRIDAVDFEAWLVSTLSRRAKSAHRAFESDLVDGRCLWIVETTLASGCALFVATDITGLRTDEHSLRRDRDIAMRSAQTDDLTGISNRRHILSVLEAVMVGQTSSTSGQGVVCVLDVDHFKQLNDTYGHQAGDDVLIGMSRAIRAAIRVKDAFGRIGGEEFMLILPDLDLPDSLRALSRVLDRLRNSRLSPTHPQIRLTCSAGLTAIAPGDTVNTVYARADRGLYAAKHGGRDRYVVT